MKRNIAKLVLAFCLAAGVAWAANSTGVVTGHHVLSAMASVDPSTCIITYSGNVNPEFKGRDTVVDLACIDATSPGSGATVVGTTACTFRDTNDQICVPGVEKCSGKFSFNVQGTRDNTGACVVPQVATNAANQTCFFVAHVSQTFRSPQQCNNVNASGPDPSGTAPCSGGCTP